MLHRPRHGSTQAKPLIISHRHRFVFFAIPKTGTHAVRRALRPHLGPQDLEQVGLFERKRFPFPQLAQFPSGHVSARQIAPVLGAEVFAAYFKFAFVRNPYDRFVSYCAFMTRDTDRFQRDPRAVMRHLIREHRPDQHLLFRPQHEFLLDADRRLAVDLLGRTESMQQDYDRACAQLGLPTTPLEKVNGSARRDYREYYDDELIARVGAYYRRDLELFGYGY